MGEVGGGAEKAPRLALVVERRRMKLQRGCYGLRRWKFR